MMARPKVADITWSAYALAMFTPEQRAAAVNAVYEPPDTLTVIPPPTPPGYIPGAPGSPTVRVTIGGVSYDPNTPQQLAIIHAAGYRFEGGRWIAPGGASNVAATADQVSQTTGGRSGLSSVQSASFVPGGSVLGTSVPIAPAVLLPSFVGGRLGVVRIGGGMRADAGGTPRRVVMGPGGSVLPQVRMGPLAWGR